jgi:hypothetical protein
MFQNMWLAIAGHGEQGLVMKCNQIFTRKDDVTKLRKGDGRNFDGLGRAGS